jgi:hypothetical protein
MREGREIVPWDLLRLLKTGAASVRSIFFRRF